MAHLNNMVVVNTWPTPYVLELTCISYSIINSISSPLETLNPYAAYAAAEAAAAPAIAPAIAAALPAVDFRPRPFPPDLAPPPDPLGRPRLRPDLPLPGLMVSEPETPGGKIHVSSPLSLFCGQFCVEIELNTKSMTSEHLKE